MQIVSHVCISFLATAVTAGAGNSPSILEGVAVGRGSNMDNNSLFITLMLKIIHDVFP